MTTYQLTDFHLQLNCSLVSPNSNPDIYVQSIYKGETYFIIMYRFTWKSLDFKTKKEITFFFYSPLTL